MSNSAQRTVGRVLVSRVESRDRKETAIYVFPSSIPFNIKIILEIPQAVNVYLGDHREEMRIVSSNIRRHCEVRLTCILKKEN